MGNLKGIKEANLECVDVRWVDSIKMGLRIIGFVGVDWIRLAENNSTVKSCCEYGNAT